MSWIDKFKKEKKKNEEKEKKQINMLKIYRFSYRGTTKEKTQRIRQQDKLDRRRRWQEKNK